MRILMLGWEFPPFISGGLGTACFGLTRALDRLGQRVMFVLPRAVTTSSDSHVEMVTPEPDAQDSVPEKAIVLTKTSRSERLVRESTAWHKIKGFESAEFLGVPSAVTSPYGEGGPGGSGGSGELGGLYRLSGVVGDELLAEIKALQDAGVSVSESWIASGGTIQQLAGNYQGDVLTAAQQYAKLVVRLCRHRRFDVVHAHDWMTYPAGMALARVTGKPLVTHIHSTEFDRSGEHVHQAVYDIERRGMHAAMKVIAVSQLTKKVVASRYGVDGKKIEVVYNGIESDESPRLDGLKIRAGDKIVLFLGRITMQKGPEYFIAAAKRVLEKIDNVKFLVAGSGDLARRMIELAAEMGIGHKVLFTGFLRGKDVERVFQMADLYVMPSVSEPFGIAPLEAVVNGTPVLISKQSGVSEVLTHALKVDFWDVDEMANKIVAVLKHPPLRQTLREHGEMDVRRLTWEGAAERCLQVYRSVLTGVAHHPVSNGVVVGAAR
jgi:glycosyltransferase involved in cell wall biosynthesis